MKNLIILLVILISPVICFSQGLFDQKWIVGRGGNVPSSLFGGTLVDFANNASPPKIDYYYVPEMYSADKNLTMSDSAGNLLFFTNGCEIISSDNQLMENGDNLNAGDAADHYCNSPFFSPWAYENYQSLMCIPYPGHPGEYILFHAAWAEYTGTDSKILFYYTHIDMNANEGMGRVVTKNQLLAGPDWILPSTSAVRHANGRDWWIMTGGYDTHIFRTWLLSPQGITPMGTQNWNSLWGANQDIALAGCFSPDGSKFVRAVSSKPDQFFLFDFDRCNGLLSSPVSLELPDTMMRYAYPIFSPNSRYLYVANRITSVYQFDLEAPDISASAVKVGKWDGVYDTTFSIGIVTGFHNMSQGNDGKIYITSYDHTVFMHVIHAPNEKGAACQFEQRSIQLPVRNESLPNYPNYRLYDLPGSSCDTLGINAPVSSAAPDIPEPVHLGVAPNPSQEIMSVVWPDARQPVRMTITDVSGRVLMRRQLGFALTGNRTQVDVSELPVGMYFISVQFEQGATGVAVFSVMR